MARKLGTIVVGSILFFSLWNLTEGAEIQFNPALLAGTDILSELPQSVQNIIRSATELNESLKTWTPPKQSFEGMGERFGETLRVAFRTFAGLLLALLAWIVELASSLVFWVAGAAVILINWILGTVQAIP